MNGVATPTPARALVAAWGIRVHHAQESAKVVEPRQLCINSLIRLRQHVAAVLWVASFITLFPGTTVVAATVLDFEDTAAGTTLTTQYGPRGVLFLQAFVETDPAAQSGTRVLRSVPPGTEIWTPQPFTITFTSAQARVKLFAGSQFASLNGTLTAFDSGGNVVATDGPRLVPQNTFTTAFQVTVATASITRVEFQLEGTAFESIDDLEFEGEPPLQPPVPPVVAIEQPVNGVNVDIPGDIPKLDIAGTVTGEGLLSPANVTITFRQPPESANLPPFQLALDLTGSGTTRQFSLPGGLTQVWLGPITVTATAENFAGLKGTATSAFTNLPHAIQTRFDNEGGAAALGDFQFGLLGVLGGEPGTCSIAVYERGAISGRAGGAIVIRGDILTKWLSLRGPFNESGWFGCPNNEEHTVGTAQAQDFAGGRIYSSPSGTFFVPSVFVSAIDILGGEAGVGVPNADPTSDSHRAFATWLFQRFARSGVPVESTLEIRGDPPRLFVERQGGDLSLFTDVVGANNPVIVESFECSTTAGPCTVAAPPDEPLFTGASALCHNKEFDWSKQVAGFGGVDPDPPEWVPVRGNFTPVPIWGVLFDVHLAKGDNPFTHRNRFEPCPDVLVVENLANETICPSDWDLKIRPLPGFGSMQPVNRNAVQIEFERVDFQHQMVAYGDPTTGDLIFAAGRFVVDCGHGGDHLDAFKTEIHPPSVYTAVKMVTRNGKPATQADIWVNWFFSGGDSRSDAVEFDIFPPPRPTPQALLAASTPGDQNEAVKVTFKAQGPFGPMRVRVTATRRTPEITKYGEMKPREETVPFGFDGRLQVFWSCPGGSC